MIIFDANEQAPYDEATSRSQAAAILSKLEDGSRVLDLGCGIGRVASQFPEPIHLEGVDKSSELLAEYSQKTKATTHMLDLKVDSDRLPKGPFDAVIMLGNTLMEFVDPLATLHLFKEISQRLKEGGSFIIDDFPLTGWREVAVGNWCDGIDETGTMQMVWAEGEPIFALRRDKDVQPENWSVDPNERKFRLWSMGELRLLGGLTGLGEPKHDEEGAVVAMKRGESMLEETDLLN